MFVEDVTPLFFAALPRSGSTFVGRSLDSHPEIVLTDAAGWVSYLRRAELLATTPGSQRVDDGEGFQPPAQIADQYVAHTAAGFRASVAGFVSGLCDSMTSSPRSLRYFGDKLHSAQDAVFALRQFDEARFVVQVRDLRDVLVSSYRFEARQPVAWAGAPFELRCEHLAETLSGFRDHIPADRRLIVRYEDVCMAPSAALMQIFAWLGLEFASSVREYVAGDGSDLFRTHGTSPAPASSIGRWRTELKSDQVRICERICGEAMAAYGYA